MNKIIFNLDFVWSKNQTIITNKDLCWSFELNSNQYNNILRNKEEKLFKKFSFNENKMQIDELEYVSVISPSNYLKVYHNSDDTSDWVITIRTDNHYALINPTTMAMTTPVSNWILWEITYTFRNSGFWYISYYDGTDTQIIKCSVLDDITVPANRTTDFVIIGEKAFVCDKEIDGRYIVVLESDPMTMYEYDNTGTQMSTTNVFPIDIKKWVAQKDNGVQNFWYFVQWADIMRIDQLWDPLATTPVIWTLWWINIVRFANEIYSYDWYTGFTLITTI